MTASRLRILPWLWHPTNRVASWLLRGWFRVDVIPSKRRPAGAVLVAAKHGSGWDIPALSWQVHAQIGLRSYFQMGSFVGYPILGRMTPVLRACGGFPVMRPKEILRLRDRLGLSREEAMARMAAVNDEAEATRGEILEHGQPLVFFPEGTRDPETLREVRGTHEVTSAVAAAARGVPVEVWPVMLRWGPKGFRRRLRIEWSEPFPVNGLSADAIARRIEESWRATFDAPSAR